MFDASLQTTCKRIVPTSAANQRPLS